MRSEIDAVRGLPLLFRVQLSYRPGSARLAAPSANDCTSQGGIGAPIRQHLQKPARDGEPRAVTEEARARRQVPRWIRTLLWMSVVFALVPPFMILRARTGTSRLPRIHPIPDMDNQLRFNPQQENPLFADHRAMRLPVEGTVARGELFLEDHFYRGTISVKDSNLQTSGRKWATGLPSQLVVDDAFMARGRERYDIFCSPCHGIDGSGKGPIAVRVASGDPEVVTNWTPPTNLVGTAGGDAAPREQPLGKLFNTITNGIRTMPPYGSQIPVADRWTIVGYLKALQRSQVSEAGDVPADKAARLNREPGLVIPYDGSKVN